MAMLREKKGRMMGIGGMGGVGKTTTAKKIMSRASKAGGEGLFDEIVMVLVSQPVDMLRIQQDIAELLGLRLEVGCLAARAHELRYRLIMNTKSILIILDSLRGWPLPPEQLGLCFRWDVFYAMNVEKTFQMKTLETEEAWSLFKEKVGACVDDPSLLPTAQQIVGECKGLPLALVTVGVALNDKTHNWIWEDALNDLRREGEDVEKSLFIKLKVLRLEKLPKFKAFCDRRCVLELSSLEDVYILECPE
ncbi:hypothetical protein ACS0TY_025544 [Phlomoides rotata]